MAHNYMQLILCRAITDCGRCVGSNCVWLNDTIMPCRVSFKDADDQPSSWATTLGDCKTFGISDIEQREIVANYGGMGDSSHLVYVWIGLGGIAAAVALYLLRKLAKKPQPPQDIELVPIE